MLFVVSTDQTWSGVTKQNRHSVAEDNTVSIATAYVLVVVVEDVAGTTSTESDVLSNITKSPRVYAWLEIRSFL